MISVSCVAHAVLYECLHLLYHTKLQRALKGMRDSPPKRCTVTAAAAADSSTSSRGSGRPSTPLDAAEKVKVSMHIPCTNLFNRVSLSSDRLLTAMTICVMMCYDTATALPLALWEYSCSCRL
jgi:hypothetical protein